MQQEKKAHEKLEALEEPYSPLLRDERACGL